MTRTVFDNDMVAHVWAQRSQEEGRSSNGNLSFLRETLYSYCTPIASFAPMANGETAVLLTSESFSKTTNGKHRPASRRAIGYDRSYVFVVPNVLAHRASPWDRQRDCGRGGNGDHTANLAYFVAQYAEYVADELNARFSPAWDGSDIRQTLRRRYSVATDYAAAFGLTMPVRDTDADAEAIMAHRAGVIAKRNDPRAVAKRARAAVAADDRRNVEREKAAIAEAFRRKSSAERVAAWLAGENVPLQWNDPTRDENGGAMLRVVQNDKRGLLQTSLGAEVPFDHAVRVFQFAKLCRERGTEWKRNGVTVRVGHFQLDRVLSDGSFHAGCHFIHWNEIERVAKLSGLFDEPASDAVVQPSNVAA